MENKIVVVSQEVLLHHQQQIVEELKRLVENALKLNEPDEVMQTTDVCKLLGKSRQTIENWAKAGIIKKRQIGDSVFYLRSEIMKSMKVVQEKRQPNEESFQNL